MPSIVAEWPTADHQEREVYDFFGIVFRDHPDLRRILMPRTTSAGHSGAISRSAGSR